MNHGICICVVRGSTHYCAIAPPDNGVIWYIFCFFFFTCQCNTKDNTPQHIVGLPFTCLLLCVKYTKPSTSVIESRLWEQKCQWVIIRAILLNYIIVNDVPVFMSYTEVRSLSWNHQCWLRTITLSSDVQTLSLNNYVYKSASFFHGTSVTKKSGQLTGTLILS